MATRTRKTPIQLNFRSEQTVVVTPESEDRFVIAEREAARACQHLQEMSNWSKSFERFLSFIHQWSQEHASWVEATYVDVAEIGLRVEVCTNKEDYDFAIDDEVTEFDITLAEKFPMCPAEVTQIPK